MDANLEFTDDEYNLLQNANVFVQKKIITEKIIQRFGKINSEIEKLKSRYAQFLPGEVIASHGKISRGENYENQPYIILDNPRVFNPDHVYAFRTLFLWGNFFSATVHISGKFYNRFKPLLENYLPQLKDKTCFISNGADAWQHHLRKDNYTPLTELLADTNSIELLTKKYFLKIVLQIPLNRFDELEAATLDFYSGFLQQYVF